MRGDVRRCEGAISGISGWGHHPPEFAGNCMSEGEGEGEGDGGGAGEGEGQGQGQDGMGRGRTCVRLAMALRAFATAPSFEAPSRDMHAVMFGTASRACSLAMPSWQQKAESAPRAAERLSTDPELLLPFDAEVRVSRRALSSVTTPPSTSAERESAALASSSSVGMIFLLGRACVRLSARGDGRQRSLVY